ncbi:hypothetical protein Moror_614 [Moniliophthora roreri MCA 2997]|uniref:Uncharacterized protein n=1 Tax=Moniliophthora roreri (strain MCA 2997) TaxID=1381753 RepID=V2XZA6_MONRO|nr:hypothetical protein Moror_614 [Moniliophthora roreri MCA 2997]
MMHLLLNLCQLLISLWRGTIDCARTDNKKDWPWATLTDNVWKNHSAAITNATTHFPSFFHHTLRNPAKKISSGFKVTEYVLYVLCLGSSHFRNILPQQYYTHFCCLIHALQILNKSIQGSELADAYTHMIQYVQDYEKLYYQCHVDCLHFCCSCIHTLLHLAPETTWVGPAVYHTQFALEQMIGDTTAECNQPSNLWKNFSQQQFWQAQTNVLINTCPKLDRQQINKLQLPWFTCNIGNKYILLWKRDHHFFTLSEDIATLVEGVIGTPNICKWSQL